MELTQSNYYERTDYMSASQFKAFRRCEASAMTPVEVTEAMLVGSYFDAMMDGLEEEFQAGHPEIVKRDGQLRAPFLHCHEMYARAMQDDLFREFVNGDSQMIFTGEIEGVRVKGKLDILHPERIVDIKTTSSFRPVWSDEHGARVSWAEAWRYDIQGAIYQELVYQATGKRLPFYLAAVTKEDVPDFGIFEIPQNALDDALAEVHNDITRYHLIKLGVTEPTRCEQCNHCRATKKLTHIRDWREIT